MKRYINGKVYTKNFKFEDYVFSIDDDGCFCDVQDKMYEKAVLDSSDVIDLKGKKIIPSLIDIHTHGAIGFDFSDFGENKQEKFIEAKTYYNSRGIGYFLATSLTVSKESYYNMMKYYDIVDGFYLEGPFISEKKKGAQDAKYISNVDFDFFKKLYDLSHRKIKVVTIAPEKEGAIPFIEKAKDLCTVSIAHTDCEYDTAKKAFSAGAKGVTHLFNAMNGIHHRDPGPIIAAIENENVSAELICDGYHVDESMIRFAFKNFGSDRIILISDSLRCLGMPNGQYSIAGQSCYLKDNVAKLSDGTIAGAATNLFEDMKNAIKYGINENDAIKASTYNPAKHIGILDKYGSIENGKKGLFTVFE